MLDFQLDLRVGPWSALFWCNCRPIWIVCITSPIIINMHSPSTTAKAITAESQIIKAYTLKIIKKLQVSGF